MVPDHIFFDCHPKQEVLSILQCFNPYFHLRSNTFQFLQEAVTEPSTASSLSELFAALAVGLLVTQCSNPQHFWYKDLLALLKITGDAGNFSLGGSQPSIFFML